jgi:hypothetical protein
MKPFCSALIAGLIAAATAPAIAGAQQAQQRDSSKKATVPAEARPPKGMCRVWLDGVPAAQQPAATDCPTAIKNRPQNGTVIFGDDYASDDSTKKKTTRTPPPNAKGFTGVKPPSPIVFPTRPPE